MIIDFHTHTFPDKIAAAAIDKLQRASHSKAFTSGTVSGFDSDSGTGFDGGRKRKDPRRQCAEDLGNLRKRSRSDSSF